jgi:hypothetical protein
VLEQLPQLLSVVLQLDMQLATIRDNGLRDIFTLNSFQIHKHSLKPAPQQSQKPRQHLLLSYRQCLHQQDLLHARRVRRHRHLKFTGFLQQDLIILAREITGTTLCITRTL